MIGNEGLVHHILLYYCPSAYVDEDDVGLEEDCNVYRNMAVGSADCVFGTAAYAWAVGGEDFYFPQDVGLEMSGTNNADGSELEYVLLGMFNLNISSFIIIVSLAYDGCNLSLCFIFSLICAQLCIILYNRGTL